MKAILDIGSNTILCLIGSYQSGNLVWAADEVEVVKLSQGLSQTGLISQEALQRAESTFMRFKKIIDANRVSEIHLFATAFARRASNVSDLQKLAHKFFNQKIQVLSGIEEAEYSFLGCREVLPENQFGVLDIGGASTEFVVGTKNQLKFSHSFDMGAVTLTEDFGLEGITSDQSLQNCRNFVSGQLRSEPLNENKLSALVSVAGTPTEIARVAIGSFDKRTIDTFELTQVQLEAEILKLSKCSSSERVTRYGYNEKRAGVILAGCILLSEVLNFIEKEATQVSSWGLRLGALKKLEGIHK